MSGRPRHLGYVLKRFPRISETFVAAEIIELERQGERVTVFAVHRPEEPWSHDFLREMRAKVVYLPYRPLRQPGRVVTALARALRANPRGWLRAAAAVGWPPRLSSWRHLFQATVLHDELVRAGVDHAHAHFATAAASLANLAWRMGGPTYSVTAHAKDIYDREVRVDRLRRRLGEARFVATVSSANRVYLERLLAQRVAVHVIHNAVDPTRLDPGDRRRREPNLVLAVARLVEKKGLHDLVAAVGLLGGRGIDVRLVIAGDGPLRSSLEVMAEREAAPVTFRGALRHEDIVDLYRRAAVFCLPCVVADSGDRDGLPTSVLEAMAVRVPVVTTAVNGLAEVVVDGETGLIVPERDPPALAAAIERLLVDPRLADRLARRARQVVRREFSLDGSVAALRTFFPEVA